MSDFFRGYVTGILVYMVVLLAVPMCSRAKADMNTYKSLIAHEAVSQGLDPAVALAVAEVESNFDPKATGKKGEVGLFQLHPMFHKNPSYDVNKNVNAGIKHLMYWQKYCPTKKDMTYVLCFNRGTRPVVNPKTAPYYKKFIQRYRLHAPPTTSPVARGPGFPSN
jgi:hypothetical protein